MTKDILIVNRDGGGIGTKVYENASTTLLGIGEDAVGKGYRSQVELCDGYSGLNEARIEVVVELLAPKDIEEVTLKAHSLNAHRINLILLVDLILLDDSVENFLLRITHTPIGIHKFIDNLAGNHSLLGIFLDYDIADTAYGLASNANIHLRYLTLELRLELVYNVSNTLTGLGNVIDDSLADTLSGVLGDHSKDIDTAVKVLPSCNTTDF